LDKKGQFLLAAAVNVTPQLILLRPDYHSSLFNVLLLYYKLIRTCFRFDVCL